MCVPYHWLIFSRRHLVDSGTEYPQPSRSVIVGRCIGLLAATAVSCSESIAGLVSLAPEMVALAFRIGFLVQTRTAAVAGSSACTIVGSSSSCSAVVANVDQEQMATLLQEYCQSSGFPAATSLYLSAVGHGNVTVSGPPEHLAGFFRSGHGHNLSKAPVLIRGLFHAPHLYTLDEAKELLRREGFGSSRLFHTRPVRLSVLSNADGRVIPEYFEAATTTTATTPTTAASWTAADLLEVAIGEMLTQPMRWNQMTERAMKMLASSHDETIVLGFGAGSSVQAFGKAPGFHVLDTTTTGGGEAGRRGTPPPSPEQQSPTRSKIAIVGFSGRYPESESNEEFWQLLMAGRDVHREIPRDRFDPWLYYDETGKRKNTSGVRHGCFLKNPGLFDAKFFGLSPREAEQADPAQRLALMTAYEAMEMAGLVPDATPSTQRDRIGVFYGTASDDYRECNSGQDIDTYFVPGGSRAFLPARINYQWRFSGPSLDVDTACSSSLAALHMACNCLWRGDCDTALAGGTNVLTNPDNWAGLDRAHFLSRTGNCATFDDGADGYCRSESVSTVVLKRLDDALRDGDPVFGTILGAYTNHSAEAVSMTRPHSGAQRAIFGRVLAGAGVHRDDVSYVEMHGTGTQAGDACEMDAVLNVFAPTDAASSSTSSSSLSPSSLGRCRRSPLYLGSAKANIGHAESASGVASLIKVLLMMQHDLIPPHVGIKTRINRNFPLDLAQRNVHIASNQGAVSWPRPSVADKPHGRRAFVNNFGAAGGNSSVLLEDAPAPTPLLPETAQETADPRPVHLVAVSARTKTALHGNIRALRAFLDTAVDKHNGISLSSLSYTTTARRMHHSFRAMVAGSSVQEIRDALCAMESDVTIDTRTNCTTATPPMSFCFTGQGCSYPGMGRELLKMPPVRAIMTRLDGLVQLHGFPSVLSVLLDDDAGNNNIAWEDLAPVQVQLAQTCLQMALSKYLLTLGLVPELVVGHSLGEYAAMNAAGMLSDAETIYLVGTRAMLLQEYCTAGTHTMLAVKASLQQVTAALAAMSTSSSADAHHNHLSVEVACVNGPQDTVVAGPTTEIDRVAQAFGKQSVKTTRLPVPFAFHSAQVEPMLAPFRQSCRAIVFREPKVPILSPLLGRVIRSLADLGGDGAADDRNVATYFTRHCREPVGFSTVLQEEVGGLEANTNNKSKMVWIEVGPHPICATMLRNTLQGSTGSGGVRALPTLRRNESDWKGVTSALATLYESGFSVNWAEYHRGFGGAGGRRVLPLPAYQWDLKKYWIPYRHDWCLTKGDAPVPVTPTPTPIQESSSAPEEAPFTASVQRIVDESHAEDVSTITARSNVKYPKLMAVLLGHRINGMPMCPSSVYADMALTLFTRLLDQSPSSTMSDRGELGVGVADMVVDKALLLDQDAPAQWVEMKATANWSSRTASFTLSSVGSSDHGQRTTAQHARCTGSFTPKSQWKAEWKRRRFLVWSRIQHLQQALHQDDDGDDRTSGNSVSGQVQLLRPSLFYKLFASIVEYGADFRGLRELIMHPVELECTARIRFNTGTAAPTAPTGGEVADPDWGGCSPYWIESLGQITGFVLNGNDALDTETQVFINHGWGHMRLLTPLSPSKTYRTYVKMHKDQDQGQGQEGSYSGDAYIFDASDGEMVGMYEGVVFNSLRRSIFNRLLPPKNLAQPQPAAQQSSAPPPKPQADGPPPAQQQHATSLGTHHPAAPSAQASVDNTAARVRALVADEVGVPATELTDNDDLVELGVDSLLALTMADRIQEEFGGVTVPSTVFMEPLTVRDLIRIISADGAPSAADSAKDDDETSDSGSSSLSRDIVGGEAGDRTRRTTASITPASSRSSLADLSLEAASTTAVPTTTTTSAPKKKLPPIPPASSVLLQGNPRSATKTLWLVPDGSGLATSYLALPDIDPTSLAVYALNSPFISSSNKSRNGPEELCMSQRSFSELTDAYLSELRRRQPHGPYYLGGWSAGGICAYDLAQRLSSAGESVLRLILIDTPNPIGLAKLPTRLYDEFTRLGVFGADAATGGRALPSWLLPHFAGFVDILHTYTPRPFVTADRPLQTWAIWAQDGVDKQEAVAIRPDDPPNVRWLLRDRSAAVLGTNGWEVLVGSENIHAEVLPDAHHFSLLKEPAARRVSSLLARAVA